MDWYIVLFSNRLICCIFSSYEKKRCRSTNSNKRRQNIREKKILECFSNGGGAAAIQVGKLALTLPYCYKLGLGVCKISALLQARGQIIGFDNQQRRPRHEPAAPAAARIFSNGGGAAAIQVGKSALTLPYCCRLGLGVCKISALL